MGEATIHRYVAWNEVVVTVNNSDFCNDSEVPSKIADGTSLLTVHRSKTIVPTSDLRSQFIADLEKQARLEAEKAIRVRNKHYSVSLLLNLVIETKQRKRSLIVRPLIENSGNEIVIVCDMTGNENCVYLSKLPCGSQIFTDQGISYTYTTLDSRCLCYHALHMWFNCQMVGVLPPRSHSSLPLRDSSWCVGPLKSVIDPASGRYSRIHSDWG